MAAVAGLTKTAQWIGGTWQQISLARQFTTVACAVLLLGMALIGNWVSQTIKRDVTTSTANAAALYLQSTIGPLVQELGERQTLSKETIERLNAVFEAADFRSHVISMKVWRLDGTIIYSQWPDMIGKQFPVVGSLRDAVEGQVSAEFNNEPHDEDRYEREVINPLLEIYTPVRQNRTGTIIGVAEFYMNGRELSAKLRQAMFTSWLVVGVVTLIMLSALSVIVRRGSLTIDRQRTQLSTQVIHLQSLLAQNEKLSTKLREANFEVADSNERLLQRIGADLHDGPTQLLAYAMMRLGRFAPVIERAGDAADHEELRQMRMAISDSLREVRNISAGLSLPDLETKSLAEAISLAVQQHMERTGTKARFVPEDLPAHIPKSLKVCAYRFVQEALTNAFRHAGGLGQCVECHAKSSTANILVLSVSDDGPGMPSQAKDSRGLGLVGLSARIEALGGDLMITSRPGAGVKLIATFAIGMDT